MIPGGSLLDILFLVYTVLDYYKSIKEHRSFYDLSGIFVFPCRSWETTGGPPSVCVV